MDAGPKDEELIASIGRGEEAALVVLMGRHKQAVYNFVYRYLNNDADSAEVTEEAFFKVYQNAARFQPKASAKTWIFSIALNLTRDRLRKRKKSRGEFSYDQVRASEGGESSMLDHIDSGERSPVAHSQTSDDLRAIHSSIERLPEKLRFPFVFCVLEEHSYDECSAIIKSSRKTVETRIYRARQALRSLLEDLVQKV